MLSDRSVKIYCWALGAVLLGVVVLFAVRALHLTTQYSVNEFFPKYHPVLREQQETERRFQLAETPSYLMALSLKSSIKGDWLSPQKMQSLSELTKKISGLESVKQARSLANLELAIDDDNTIKIGPMWKDLPREDWKEYVQSHPVLQSQLISKDLRSVLVVVEPSDRSTQGMIRLEARLKELAANPEWTTSMAGIPAVQLRLADRLSREVVKFFLLCIVLFCLMFLVFYRNAAPLFFAAAGLIVTNVTSLGWLGVFQVPFTVLLSTLPVIVSITFVSITIHTLHLWSARDHSGENTFAQHWAASFDVLKELALPNLLGSLTTSIGFITLATANIPAIRTYALVVAVIVIWTWFVSQIFLLGFLHRLKPVPRDWNHRRAWWMLEMNRWSISIITISIGAGLCLAGNFTKMNFSGRLFDDLPNTESVRASTEKLDSNFGGTVNLDVALKAPKADAWKAPERLVALSSAVDRVRKISGVGSAISVADILGPELPDDSGALAERYFLFSLDPESPLKQYVSADFRETRVAIRLRDVPSAQVESIREQVRSLLHAVDPSAQIRESGVAVNSHVINKEVARQLVFGFWQSLLIIGVFLIFIFRSVRWALVACLPNLLPPAILIGTLAFFQTPVKPGVALVFSIALGLAFNNTVYLLARLRRIQSKMKMITLPLRRALLEEGNPCFSESFIMLVGFLIFLASDFKLNQTFGAYMVLSVIAGALGDLVLLPALLRRFSSFFWVKPWDGGRWNGGIAVLALLVCVGLVGSAPSSDAAVNDAENILKKAREKLDAKTDQANVKMKIIEPNGDTKLREMRMETMQYKDGFKALIRMLSPVDVKGMAFLEDFDGKNELQWIYLPSSKQVRRVGNVSRSAGIMGSELTPEDLNIQAIHGSKAKLVKKEKDKAIVEVTPGGKSEYTKVRITFSMPDYLPVHTDYLTGDQVKKTVDFDGYKAVGKVMRAQGVHIKNLENKRGTEITLGDLVVNAKIPEENFSETALKGND